MTTRSLTGPLQHLVRGEVIAPGDPEYDSARQVWNGMIDLCRTDVVSVVNVLLFSGCHE